jgi:hypothetical protein
MKNLNPKLILLAFLTTILSSCSESLTQVSVETPEIQLVAEGPLFEGANTSTATWEFNLNELLGDTQGKVSKAKVTSVEITLLEGDEVVNAEKMVFELTSQNTSMTRIGLYEGDFQVGQNVLLNIADKQDDLASAFQDGKITFVGDFDLKDEEFWGSVKFKLKVNFELGIK